MSGQIFEHVAQQKKNAFTKKGIAFQTWCEADIYVNLPISVSNFWKGLVSFPYACTIDQGPKAETPPRN